MDSSDGEQDSEWMAIIGVDDDSTANPGVPVSLVAYNKRQKLGEGRRNRFDVHVSPCVRRHSTSVFGNENMKTYGNRGSGDVNVDSEGKIALSAGFAGLKGKKDEKKREK